MATLGRRKNRVRPLITAFVVLLLVGFFVHAVNSRTDGSSNPVTSGTLFLAEPFLRAGSAVRDRAGAVWQSLFASQDLRDENERLREELAQLRVDKATERSRQALASLTQDISTNIPSGAYDLVPAAVLSGPAPGGPRVLWLGVGRDKALLPGMVVLSPQGIVGMVEEVYDTTALVQLITDPMANWGAEVDGRGEIGLLRGTGTDDMIEFHFNRTAVNAQTGDMVVSSGMTGSLAPGGVPFGEIREVTYNKKGEPIAIVQLPEEPARLRTVFVLPEVRIPTEFPPQ